MPVVSLDLDGVLADFTWGWRALHNELYGGKRPYSTGAQPIWEYSDLPQEEVAGTWRAVARSSDFWFTLPTLYSQAETWMLHKIEHEIIYVTNRQVGKELYDQTRQWLDWRGLPEGYLHITRDKASVLRTYGDTLLAHIDDAPHNIEALSGLGLPVVIRDWPYNRHLEGPRVGSLAEFLSMVEGMS